MCGKMAEELLSLKWNNHQAHFVDILTFLREQEIFVDATLACGGKLYAAHKFVLSTCSDYFKQMFTRSPSKHPIVYMKDVTARDLEALLDFMYNGEVNVPQSSLGSLIKTAEGLQIKGLAVPDDPPTPKRERDREKEREHKVHLEHSPPAKRPRPRERSPPHSAQSLPQTPSVPRSRSPPHPPTPAGASQVNMPPVEATLDEDSRTSVHSANSNLSEQNSAPSLSSKQPNSGQGSSGDNTPHQDHIQSSNPSEEPSPGPSGVVNPQHSKQEPEVDIKQEDVVDLGDEEEGDWNLEGDGGGGESSLGGSENPNFPEVMLPPADGSVPASGDPAMSGGEVLLNMRRTFKKDPDQPADAKSDVLAAATWEVHTHSTSNAPGLACCLSSNFYPVTSSVTAVASLGEGSSLYQKLVDVAASTSGRGAISDVRCNLPLNPMDCSTSKGDLKSLDPLSAAAAVAASNVGVSLEDNVERPYPCQFCDSRFKKKQHLQNHERIHTGEKYVCTVCGQAFSRMHILKHHRERKHGVESTVLFLN